MSHVEFFGTKEDLLPVIESVESQIALKYVLTGDFSEREIKGMPVFEKGADIPNLGKASDESSDGCDSLLVCERKITIKLDRFRYRRGVRISVDQRKNPHSVVFSPGGLWKKNVLLDGC